MAGMATATPTIATQNDLRETGCVRSPVAAGVFPVLVSRLSRFKSARNSVALSTEWERSGSHFVTDRAEGKHVRARIELFPQTCSDDI